MTATAYLACLEYADADRRPNHELGVWGQTKERWREEAPDAVSDFGWDWFYQEDALGLDHRDYVDVDYGFIPRFEEVIIEEDDTTRVFRDRNGITRRTLTVGAVGGTSMSMDEFIDFPVREPADFKEVKKRLIAGPGCPAAGRPGGAEGGLEKPRLPAGPRKELRRQRVLLAGSGMDGHGKPVLRLVR